MHAHALDALAHGQLEQRQAVADVGVHAAVGHEAHHMQGGLTRGDLAAGLDEHLVLKDLASLDGMVQAHELLHDHTSRSDVEMTDLGVAHLTRRQADGLAGSLDGRPGALGHEGVEVGRGGEAHGVRLAGRGPSQAVHDDEKGGKPIHVAPPSQCR